jgi:hypothetical protein
VQRADGMKVAQRLTLAGLVWCSCMVASAACRSLPSREEPRTPITGKISPKEELSLIRADSEIFAAVVRAQLAGGEVN